MVMSYNRDFSDQTQNELIEYISDPKKFEEYTIEFPEGLADPPTREVCKVFEIGYSFDNKERLAKYCILHKEVRVLLEGKVAGGFRMNSLTDEWDLFPVIKDHPMSLNLLIDVCMAQLIKKYKTSPKSTVVEKT